MSYCPKHVEFYSKNKFEKLVHLVGFIIRTNAVLCPSSILFTCDFHKQPLLPHDRAGFSSEERSNARGTKGVTQGVTGGTDQTSGGCSLC